MTPSTNPIDVARRAQLCSKPNASRVAQRMRETSGAPLSVILTRSDLQPYRIVSKTDAIDHADMIRHELVLI